MRYYKDRPIGILLFPFVIIVFNLYYWLPVLTGTWEMIDTILTPTPFNIFFWANVGLSIIEIAMVTVGFYYRNNYARFYEIGYLSYSTFWAFYSIFIMNWQIYEHYLYFVLYIVLISYLLMSDVKAYFTTDQEMNICETIRKPDYYQLGEYILHRREVKKRGGGTRTFYFFSKELSDKGNPCNKPDDYIVTYNQKTGVPSLKKLTP